MKNKIKITPLLLSFMLLVSCGTNKPVESLPIKFGTIKKLGINRTTKAEIILLLGKPHKILDPNSEVDENWLYLQGQFQTTRLSLSFDTNTNLLQSIGWFVTDSDEEVDLEKAKSHFLFANFERQDAKWVNSHAGPDEVYFSASDIGVEIEYKKNQQKVRSIIWRNLASPDKNLDRNPANNYQL